MFFVTKLTTTTREPEPQEILLGCRQEGQVQTAHRRAQDQPRPRRDPAGPGARDQPGAGHVFAAAAPAHDPRLPAQHPAYGEPAPAAGHALIRNTTRERLGKNIGVQLIRHHGQLTTELIYASLGEL